MEQFLASLSVAGESLPICQDHHVILMNGLTTWNNAGEKMLCKTFSGTGNVEVSEARIFSVEQSIHDSFTIKTELETLTCFSMQLSFPYLNRVSIY